MDTICAELVKEVLEMVEKKSLGALELFQFGKWLGRLESIIILRSHWVTVDNCLEALSLFKEKQGLESIGLDAEGYRRDYGPHYPKHDTPITPADSQILGMHVSRWLGAIPEILKSWFLCCVEAQIDIAKLNKGGKSFLTEEEWNMLQPIEKHGLDEAAFSLLSNNFTSSEFMALRTVEALLRRWYEKTTGDMITDVTFGQVLRMLDERFPEKRRPREISALYYFKERRNNIAHPEVISTVEQASTTFIQVIGQCKTLKSILAL
jgi:hypothetical protein